MIVVSGQVKRETCMSSYPGLGLRQLGDQEADIISLVEGMTKYAVQLTDPGEARPCLDLAIDLSTDGRQGPVWIDVPIDVQSAEMPETDAAMPRRVMGASQSGDDLDAAAGEVVERLAHAERPVILAGTGVRLAGAGDELVSVAERLGVPLTTAWTHDLLSNDHPLWCGRPGTIGDRAGNFAVQNADLLIVLGSRLNVRQVSYNWTSFAPGAYIVQVDIDAAELRKPTVRPHLGIVGDAGGFLLALEAQLDRRPLDPSRFAPWLAWCRERVVRYPVVQEHQRRVAAPINPYHFVETLFGLLGDEDIVVTGNGAACVVTFQAARLRKGQRLFSNSGAASMGYDLPAALGAAVAAAEGGTESRGGPGKSGRRVVCLAGDGSLQMNVQELQTLATHRWPVKIFVFDNGGYLSIRSSQENFFDGLIGESPLSGVGFPDWTALAEAYGIAAVRLEQPATMAEEIAAALATREPCLVHVVLDPKQGFEPRVRSRTLPDGTIVSPALDDLYPFLSREELAQNRIAADGGPA